MLKSGDSIRINGGNGTSQSHKSVVEDSGVRLVFKIGAVAKDVVRDKGVLYLFDTANNVAQERRQWRPEHCSPVEAKKEGVCASSSP